MYRCELCAHVPELKGKGPKVWPPRTPCIRVPIEFRPAEYPSRPKAQKARVGKKLKHYDDPGGAGWEIAEEVRACPECAEIWQGLLAEQASRAYVGDALGDDPLAMEPSTPSSPGEAPSEG